TRILKTDRTIGDQWLVSDGLKAGDRLIVDGLQKVRPGMSVKPLEQTTTAAQGNGLGGNSQSGDQPTTNQP
ncbi:MAG TPA: hypothetical protein VF920_00490, partial [Dongiaceae bacterium]